MLVTRDLFRGQTVKGQGRTPGRLMLPQIMHHTHYNFLKISLFYPKIIILYENLVLQPFTRQRTMLFTHC